MDAQALLETLQTRGFSLTLVNGGIAVKPAPQLTDEDRAAIREHKAPLLEFLRQPGSALQRLPTSQPERRYTLADKVVIIRNAYAVTHCWLCAGLSKQVKLYAVDGGLLHCPGCNWRFVIETPTKCASLSPQDSR